MTRPKHTYIHKSVDVNNLTIDDISFYDLIYSLPHLCRYNGRLPIFFSVAQHCNELTTWLSHHSHTKHLAPYALLHDASEAYIGDLIYPIKQLYPSFFDIEQRITNLFYQKVGLPIQQSILDELDFYDRTICINEMISLNIFDSYKDYYKDKKPLPDLQDSSKSLVIYPTSIKNSRTHFINNLNTHFNLNLNIFKYD